jgi:hypothetical protein
MARENGTVKVFAWREVSFPLWQEPRPQIEFLNEVKPLIQKNMPWEISTNLQRFIDSGDRKSWVEWSFAGPITEQVRLEIQAGLVEYYGKDAASHFRWSGSKATTTIEAVFELGEHIQSGTQPY